jgi:hypothetical protein
MVSNFGDAFRGNRDPIHLLRAPFRCGDSSRGPVVGTVRSQPVSFPSIRPVLPELRCAVGRPSLAPTAEF